MSLWKSPYGKVRMLSNYNHTFDDATVNAKILHRICEEFSYKVSIRTRANNAGAVLTNEILHGPCAPVDFSFLFDTLFFLFESVKMNRFQIKVFEYLINNYSNYLQSSDYPQVKVASVYCGTMPHYRYVTNKYVQSLLPVPSLLNTRSPFDFFVTNKKIDKRLKKVQNYQWFLKLLCNIASIKVISGDIIKMPFPRFYPTQENAEIYNTISYWFETMMNKLHGEIDYNEEPNVNLKNVSDDSIIRLDFSFNKVTSKDVPCDSSGVPIKVQFNEEDDDEIESTFNEEDDSFEDNVEIDEDDVPSKMEECIQEFMDNRIDLIKTKTKDYVLSRIYRDMETIMQIINSNQDDFLANQMNDLKLRILSNGPINVTSKSHNENEIDEDNDALDQTSQFSFYIDTDDEHESTEE